MSETNSGGSTAVVQYVPQPIALGQARGLPTVPEIEIMRVIASTVAKAAGMVPDWIKTEEQALAVMIAGHEMGLAPMTALRHVFIVNGRTEFDSQILMGLIKAGDPSADFEFERLDREGCIVTLHRAGKRPLRVSYLKADAEASGQLTPKQRKKYAPDDWYWDAAAKKNKLKSNARSIGMEDIPGPWQLYPRDMYAWAAIKRTGRLGAPEIINGIPTHAIRELIEAPAWVKAPDPTKALNPGDEGPVSPVIASIVAAPEMADPDTGEIFDAGDEDEQDAPDYPMAGVVPTDEEDEAATPTEDGQAGQNEETAPAPPESPDSPENLVPRIRELFADFVATQETAIVQRLVMRIWARWPETRGEDKNLHLELVTPENAPALRDYLAEAQRAAGVPKEEGK